jgi:signal transduction histidine kinase
MADTSFEGEQELVGFLRSVLGRISTGSVSVTSAAALEEVVHDTRLFLGVAAVVVEPTDPDLAPFVSLAPGLDADGGERLRLDQPDPALVRVADRTVGTGSRRARWVVGIAPGAPAPATEVLDAVGDAIAAVIGCRTDPAASWLEPVVGGFDHEVRGALNAVMGFAELLRSEAGDSAWMLEEILIAGQAVTALTAELRTLVRDRAGVLPVRSGRVDLAAAVGEAVLAGSADATRRRIRLVADPRPSEITADPASVDVVLRLLVRTVVRAAPEETEVRVDLEPRPGRAVVRVTAEPDGAGAVEADPFRAAVVRAAAERCGAELEVGSWDGRPGWQASWTRAT